MALIVAVVVSRRITRPLVALTAATQEVTSGGRARVALPSAPGEIGELAAAFDRMLDSLDRQDELRRAVVADVAHELRTPLTILRAACEALQDGVDTPTPERLASLHDECSASRDWSRISKRSPPPKRRAAPGTPPGRPRRARRPDAARSLTDQATDAGITLETDLQPVTVVGDAHGYARSRQPHHQCHQVHPSNGTVTIEVGARDELAVLEVRDTGPGIPETELPHVFDRFWRVCRGSGHLGSGSGSPSLPNSCARTAVRSMPPMDATAVPCSLCCSPAADRLSAAAVIVPCMPADACPGTVQRNGYAPGEAIVTPKVTVAPG